MSSLIEGYNYDIFISYRQKDNKHEGWVTEFVNNLRGELESTFKEEISVYFDINPHDGLLETHDVEASLKEKLKCLIFIPIISRTYCDPKSFAWEHEFKAFVEMASKDQHGLKVKLPNGNVASRILPIRIHDIDPEDVLCYEECSGGVIRTLDFVFKTSTGVNRPLKPKEDHPGDNLNKTYYHDQINKVALSVKEIFQGIKSEPPKVNIVLQPEESQIKRENKIVTKAQSKSDRPKLLLSALIIALLLIVAIIIYPRFFKPDTLKELRSSGERISVAVMPFQNMTNDTTWSIWQNGIQDILIYALSNSQTELKVIQSETTNSLIQSNDLINFTAITPSVAISISRKLDANVFICGNLKQAGQVLRIYAQLIDSKREEVLKSFQVEGRAREENLFLIIDSLSLKIRDYLIMTRLKAEITPDYQNLASTSSPEAYRYFILGENARRKSDDPLAARFYAKAIGLDSNFYLAIMRLSTAFNNHGLYNESKKWCLKVYNIRDRLPLQLKLLSEHQFAYNFETPYEEIKCLRKLLEIDNQSPTIYYLLGFAYKRLNQPDKAIPEFEKALEIYKKWGVKPYRAVNYTFLGDAYHKEGRYDKEKQLYKLAESDFPDSPGILQRQAILALTEGDNVKAGQYLEEFKSLLKESSLSEANILQGMALIYDEAGMMKKATEYYQQALNLEPENPTILNNLAYLYYKTNSNINEGLNLIDKALKLSPDIGLFLATKGELISKQGRYKEALELFEKSWKLRSGYNHEIFLDIQATKKALSMQ